MAPYCLKRKLMKRMRSKAHVSGQYTHPTEPHHTKHHQQLSGHKRMDCLVRHLCDALLVLHSEHQEIEMLLWFSFFLLCMLLRAMNYYFRGIVVVFGFLLSNSVPWWYGLVFLFQMNNIRFWLAVLLAVLYSLFFVMLLIYVRNSFSRSCTFAISNQNLWKWSSRLSYALDWFSKSTDGCTNTTKWNKHYCVLDSLLNITTCILVGQTRGNTDKAQWFSIFPFHSCSLSFDSTAPTFIEIVFNWALISILNRFLARVPTTNCPPIVTSIL